VRGAASHAIDVDGIPDALGVHRIATAEDIEAAGSEGEVPSDSYWVVGFTLGSIIFTVELQGTPGSVSEEQALEIANAYCERLTGDWNTVAISFRTFITLWCDPREDAHMDEVEVVVAHHERVTLRVGDVFLKIDTDQTRTDVEVEAMAMAPIPTPEVLWRELPVLAGLR
jgi:hypothetical protein